MFLSSWKEYFDILAIDMYPWVSNGETYLTTFVLYNRMFKKKRHVKLHTRISYLTEPNVESYVEMYLVIFF